MATSRLADVVKVRTQSTAGLASQSMPAADAALAGAARNGAAASAARGAALPGRTPVAVPIACKDAPGGAKDPRGVRFMSRAPLSGAKALTADQMILRRPAVFTYLRIARTEGVIGGLYAGFVPNLLRNTIISASEIVAYDRSKHQWKSVVGLQEGPVLHVAAGLTAGLVATVLGSPMDVVSTRIMVNRGKPGGGEGPGMLQSIAAMYRAEGLASFYQGFLPNFMRIGSFNIVLWMSYEQLKLRFG